MAKACITKHNGSPAICVDGQFIPPMTATVVTCRTPLGETGRTIDVDYYKALGDAGININNMVSKSKKDYAYTMLDTADINDDIVAKLAGVENVIKIRVIK